MGEAITLYLVSQLQLLYIYINPHENKERTLERKLAMKTGGWESPQLNKLHLPVREGPSHQQGRPQAPELSKISFLTSPCGGFEPDEVCTSYLCSHCRA